MWAIAIGWIKNARISTSITTVASTNKHEWVKKLGEDNTARLFDFLGLSKLGVPSYIPSGLQLQHAIYAFKKVEWRLEALSPGTTKQVVDEITF
jgi:hypothetical protein